MLTELTPEEYARLGIAPLHCYNSVEFTDLNSDKTDSVHFLVWFNGGKPSASLILGEDGRSLRSPFSAPFGGVNIDRVPDDAMVEMILEDLRAYASEKGKEVVLTMPPEIYSRCVAPFMIRAVNTPWIKTVADYNYHYVTADAAEYDLLLPHKRQRRKLRKANSAGFVFQRVMDESKKAEVYDIISRNRRDQGYYLKMTYDQVRATEKVVPIDYFIMHNVDGEPVASAICYHVTGDVVQVIYWGDLLDYRSQHPMDYFAMKLFKHYRETGVAMVDVGPSSTDGVPNRGLCEFKFNVGCRLSAKYTLTVMPK